MPDSKDVLKTMRNIGETLLKTQLGEPASEELIRSEFGDNKEKIILQKPGKYWNLKNPFNRPDGFVVVTNQRLLFVVKLKAFSKQPDFISFPKELIEAPEVTRVMSISPAIRFKVEGQAYTFTFFSKAEAEELLQAIINTNKVGDG